MLSYFTPPSDERALTFGVKWSAIGCALTLFGLASCSYLIPEDSRPPRYNAVIGERRTPALNRAVGANMPDPATGMSGESSYGSAPMGALPQTNGGAVNNQAFVPAPMGAMPSPTSPGAPIPQANAQPQRGFFGRSKDWIFGDDAEIRKTPIPLGRPLPPGASNTHDSPSKSVEMAMGSSSDYPDLETVQEVSPATIAAHEKLTQATAALKIDEQRANAARDALAREATAEPTLMEAYQKGQLPIAATSTAPNAPTAETIQITPQAEMFDFTTPENTTEIAAEEPPPPPAATVNIVRGVQSETIELREPTPAPTANGRGYLPDSRYETNATN